MLTSITSPHIKISDFKIINSHVSTGTQKIQQTTTCASVFATTASFYFIFLNLAAMKYYISKFGMQIRLHCGPPEKLEH